MYYARYTRITDFRQCCNLYVMYSRRCYQYSNKTTRQHREKTILILRAHETVCAETFLPVSCRAAMTFMIPARCPYCALAQPRLSRVPRQTDITASDGGKETQECFRANCFVLALMIFMTFEQTRNTLCGTW